MSGFTPSGSGGVSTSTTISSEIVSYSVLNVSVPTANTEVEIPIPSTTVWFEVYNRTDGLTKLGFAMGDSGTLYSTINPGDAHEYSKKSGSTLSIFVQCPKGSQTVEVTLGHSV